MLHIHPNPTTYTDVNAFDLLERVVTFLDTEFGRQDILTPEERKLRKEKAKKLKAECIRYLESFE